MEPWNPIGTHVVAELSLCEHIAHYDDFAVLEATMFDIVAKVGLNKVSVDIHKFAPHGISCTVILQESHISTHISPDIGYAALDIYTCNPENEERTHKAAELFIKALGAKAVRSYTIKRGLPTQNSPGVYTLSASPGLFETGEA